MNKKIEELLIKKCEMTKDCILNVSAVPEDYWENEIELVDLLKDYYGDYSNIKKLTFLRYHFESDSYVFKDDNRKYYSITLEEINKIGQL